MMERSLLFPPAGQGKSNCFFLGVSWKHRINCPSPIPGQMFAKEGLWASFELAFAVK